MSKSRRYDLLALVKCRHADRYKAIFRPRCGCETCWRKWETKQQEKTCTR